MANSEKRACQNCKGEFEIDASDFKFYEKIQVPPPTFCPGCRAQRRLAFRSGIKLYQRKTKDNKEVISCIPEESPYKIVSDKYWWSDDWNPMDYAQDYDFSKPFFEQFKDLLLKINLPHRRVIVEEGSEYCNNAIYIKNCYLCFNAGYTEDSMYSESINKSKDCSDTLRVESCELCYELFYCRRCYKCFFSQNCTDCIEVFFSRNLKGCEYCFGCINLKNKKYYIFDKPYTKEEYYKKINEFELGSFKNISDFLEKSQKFFIEFPVKFMQGVQNVHVNGDYLDNCKDVNKSFYCEDLENCSYSQLILFLKSSDCMDISVAGGELCYELQEAGGFKVFFSYVCLPQDVKSFSSGAVNVQYSMHSWNISDVFGCVGIRNKKYCILNKQYSEDEYKNLLPRIIQHMNDMPYKDKEGKIYRYGEFFPPEFSPFPYNDTWAQEYFPLKKEEAVARGYFWKDHEARDYGITLSAKNLPDLINDVEDSILDEVIGCLHEQVCDEQCTKAFRIIPQELEFYRKMNLPLPRLCPNCRHSQRIKHRNSFKLWKRKCMCDYEIYKNATKHDHEGKCPNEFETSYAPERPEIVYCEDCYNKEVL